MDDGINYSPSFKHRLKSSLCLSPSFASSRETLITSSPEKPKLHPHPHRTSPRWSLISKTHELPNLISRIGRNRRTRSADFRYDAGSYALNFDEGYGDDHYTNDHDSPLKDFVSRLPASPPRAAVEKMLPPLPEVGDLSVAK